jgi:hypothetical protein
MSDDQRFVIRATSASGLDMWISMQFGEHRVFAPRENAEVFPSPSEAQSVIGSLPLSFGNAGFVFSVESAE